HAVNVVHEGLHALPLARRKDLARTQHAGVFTALVALEGDAELLPHLGRDQLAAESTDRAGDRALVGKNRLRPAGDVVAAAAGDIAHGDHERLLGLHALGGVEDDLAGHRRAAL